MSQNIYTYDPTNDQLNPTSGGHIIKDESGASMTQRSTLQFDGLDVTDDSTNGATKVTARETNFVGTTAEWQALSSEEKAKYKTIDLTDDFNGMPIDSSPTSGSTNPVQSGGVYTALSGKANTADLGTAAAKDSTNAVTVNSTDLVESGAVYSADKGIYEVMGQNGAKNVFPLLFSDIKAWNAGGTWNNNAYTYRGVTYTCTVKNGYITKIDLTGTCETNASIFDLYGTNISGYWLTNKYKGMRLSGGKSADISLQARGSDNDSGSGRVDYNDTGDGVIIGDKPNLRILILVSVGTSTGVSIEPMIRLASDTDPTYQPYAETNKELTKKKVSWDDFSEMGSVNILENDATTQTTSGITFTRNADGSITCSGTATVNITYNIKTQPKMEDGKKYLLKSFQSRSSANAYLSYSDIQSADFGDYDGNGVVITKFDYSTYPNSKVRLRILSGTSFETPMTFYPLLTPILDYSGPYAPHAMTNQELTAENEDIYEVMGQNGCINIAPMLTLEEMKARNTAGTWNGTSYTYRGITFDVDFENNVITTNGTSNADMALLNVCYFDLPKGTYRCSSSPMGNRTDFNYRSGTVVYDPSNVENGNGIGLEVTSDYATIEVNVHIRYSGTKQTDVVYKPMITDAKVLNSDYKHYVKYSYTNQQLTSKTDGLFDNMMDNGAVNLLANNVTTQTVNGITFTANADGTVTANGTATAYTEVTIHNYLGAEGLKQNAYKITGCPNGGSESTYQIFARSGSDHQTIYHDYGDGGVINDNLDWIKLNIKNGQTVSNLVFKPMISDPSLNLSYDDYVPYAMTNRELTEEVKDIHTLSSRAGTVFDLTITGGAGGDNGTRALVFGGTFIGWLAYYGNQWNLTMITKKNEQTVTVSNNSSSGLRITFSQGDTVNILPMNLGGSNFTITYVS